MADSEKRRPPAAELLALGETVRRLRLAKGLVPEDLAQTSGLTRMTIMNVERGHRDVRVGTLIDIARALGIGLGDLIAQAGIDSIDDDSETAP